LTLLCDTSAFLDLDETIGLTALSTIATVEILETTVHECSFGTDQNIHERVQAAGLLVVNVDGEEMYKIQRQRIIGMSVQDSLNLNYAHQKKRTLLTSELALLETLKSMGGNAVDLHWVTKQLAKHKR
jgi:hypothetical protein